MGFMDKAKEAAAQASQIAQQGIAQGQARLDDVQGKQNSDTLMRKLGEAFYAEQRQGGPREAVLEALNAVDHHVASQAAAQHTDAAAGTDAQRQTPPASSGGSNSSGPTPGGNFTLDDL